MFGVLQISSFLAVTILFHEAYALECYQCFTPDLCRGKDRHTVVDCGNEDADKTIALLTQIYPQLGQALPQSEKYACVSVNFTEQGRPDEDLMVRGCLYEAKDNMCNQTTIPFNGNLSCSYCNQNRCNTAVGLGYSLLLIVGGWLLSQIVKTRH